MVPSDVRPQRGSQSELNPLVNAPDASPSQSSEEAYESPSYQLENRVMSKVRMLPGLSKICDSPIFVIPNELGRVVRHERDALPQKAQMPRSESQLSSRDFPFAAL